MKPRIQIITVKGIVVKDGKILCLKDHGGKWELPGGRIDFGENPEQALAREFSEELHVARVQIGSIVRAWTFLVDREESERQYVVLVYTCEISNQSLVKSDEHLEYGWFTRDEVQGLAMRDGYKEAINLVVK